MGYEFEDYIGMVLRAGVATSVIFILTGFLIIALGNQSSSFSGTSELLNFNTKGIGLYGILNGLGSGSGVYYILLGLIVLVATPVVRVLLSVIWFALEKNPLYTLITLAVLLNLMLAIFVIPYLIGY